MSGRPAGVGRIRHHVVNRARDHLPLRPLEERIDEFLNRAVMREDLVTEQREAARFLAEHGPVPRARVVTVTSTFRRRDDVAAAVRSALAQEGGIDQRVIVVDDGGGETDLVPDDPRVTVITLEANTHNAGLVRNVALRVSDSDYVAFLDDDNTWLPGHLRDSIEALEAGADLAYTGVQVVNGRGEPMEAWSEPWSRYRLALSNYVDLNAIAVRRRGAWAGPEGVLLSRLRRRPRSPRYEDWELSWRVGRLGRVTHVPAVSVRYRRSVNSSFRDEGTLDS